MTVIHAVLTLLSSVWMWKAIATGDASMAAAYGFCCGGNLLRAIDLLVKEPRCN